MMAFAFVLCTVLVASVSGTRPTQAHSLSPTLVSRRNEALLARTGAVESAHSHLSGSCSELLNHGTHFTVKVEVGSTPAKDFNLVVDTGSDALIVSDCSCHECVDGSGKQSTCYNSPAGRGGASKDDLLVLSFGSGKIYSRIASDVVKVGNVEVKMTDSLLTMVQHELTVDLRFEGILGLGQLTGGRHFHGFLEEAKISHFSMCFTSDRGFLRLNVDPAPSALESVGHMHWALDFRGVSVGPGATSPFCSASSMTSGQKTPCGAIPDSGTTLIMGPEKHIQELYAQICDAWEPCSGTSVLEKVHNLHLQLSSCEGIDSLPPLSFHLTDPSGHQVALELNGVHYVMESDRHEAGYVLENLMGASFANVTDAGTSEKRRFCRPAFGTMAYDTTENGPVWILGTPFFYKYQVYFQNHHTARPSIAFSTEPCAPCLADSSGHAAGSLLSRSHSSIRRFSGPPRVPLLDTSLPL